MKHAILRFAPIFDARMLDDPSLAREIMVQRGAFKTMTSDGEIPVVVDHDMSRVVGRVTHLRSDEYGGLGSVDWWAAHVDVDDPPAWFTKDTGVSWDCFALREQDVNGTRRILSGILREISILSPGQKPADARARVMWIGEPESPAAARLPSAAGESPGDGRVIHRYFGNAVTAVGGVPVRR